MKISLLSFLVAFVVGCAPTMYLKTATDYSYDFKAKNKVFIYSTNKTIESNRLATAAKIKLEEKGFYFVLDTSQSDLFLSSIALDYVDQSVVNIPTVETMNTSGYYNGKQFNSKSTYSGMLPINLRRDMKTFLLTFYEKDTQNIVWECFFALDKKYAESGFFYFALNQSILMFGRDFEGTIPLPISY